MRISTPSIHCVWLLAVLLLGFSPMALAQQRQPKTGSLVKAGAIGGGLGFLIGGIFGSLAVDASGGEVDESNGATIAAFGGETLGYALGCWMANERRGLVWADILAGSGVFAGTAWGLHAAFPPVATLVIALGAQWTAIVWVERAVGRRRTARLGLTPSPRGEPALAFTVGF